MGFKIKETTVLGAVAVVFALLFVAFGGGIALLATFAGSAATLIALPILLLTGKRRAAGGLFAAWGIYLAFYVGVSTVMALLPYLQKHEHQRVVGEEACADAGCFTVDKVDRATAGTETFYTVSWHLKSNEKEQNRRFPGKGLELYMFDERGRIFRLPPSADQNPLDVDLPAGGTVRRSITFNVPADSRDLFLTAKYRPYTFQSLLPGSLSLISLPPAPMIRIQ